MFNPDKAHLIGLLVAASLISSATTPAAAAVHIDGQVQSGGGAVANSTVTLWAGSAGEPRQLAQAKTADDGSFALNADATPGPGESLYLIAKGGVASVNKSAGDNPALAFLTVLGGTPPVPFTCSKLVLFVDWPDGPACRERPFAPCAVSTWGGRVPRWVGRDASPVGSCARSASTGIDRHRGGPSTFGR